MRLLINIDAPDVDAAARFYETALGLTVKRRLFDGQIIEMALDDRIFHIIPSAGGAPAFAGGEARRYARHWTPIHLDFVVDDLEAAIARAVAAGAILERPLSRAAWGAIAGFADPFGHGFCLIQLSDAGYDVVASS
jgi:predicted enzyme related to lactoylglutathione lyase